MIDEVAARASQVTMNSTAENLAAGNHAAVAKSANQIPRHHWHPSR
jgi:hypothetical protein